MSHLDYWAEHWFSTEVGLPADHVDGFIRFGLAQLPEHGFLDVAGDLRLAPSIVLAGQTDLQAVTGR